jgi:hypothetical protein
VPCGPPHATCPGPATSNLGRVLLSLLFMDAKDLLLRVIRTSLVAFWAAGGPGELLGSWGPSLCRHLVSVAPATKRALAARVAPSTVCESSAARATGDCG